MACINSEAVCQICNTCSASRVVSSKAGLCLRASFDGHRTIIEDCTGRKDISVF